MIKKIKDGVIGLVILFGGLTTAIIVAKAICKYTLMVWNLW